jgi:hypothetical protein
VNPNVKTLSLSARWICFSHSRAFSREVEDKQALKVFKLTATEQNPLENSFQPKNLNKLKPGLLGK